MREEAWFHEYGFTGPEDFEKAVEAIEALGFTFVYGGANKNPDWPGWPAHADALSARLSAAVEGQAAAERELAIAERVSQANADAHMMELRMRKAAEQRAADAEKALREIAERPDEFMAEDAFLACKSIARAALAAARAGEATEEKETAA